MSATLESAPPQAGSPQVWFAPFEAASYLRLEVQTLANYRCRGGGPRFSRRGRVVRYRRADLDNWMNGKDGK
jgi:hypothetical protein